jgi:RsmE family RNA methyltransferase
MDGSGRVWRAVVEQCSESGVDLCKVELLDTPSAAARLGLIQSLCRADKLEWVLEKCTEIGIDDIYLLEASRSIVRIPRERLDAKMSRWQKIIPSRCQTITAQYSSRAASTVFAVPSLP